MVSFYKHHIPDWMDGTEDLDAETYRTYHVIVQLIYLNEGPIANNEHGIAGRCRQHVLKFRRCFQTLMELGKLTLTNDHRIANLRATSELLDLDSHRTKAALGGSRSKGVPKSSRGSQTKTLENNETETVPLFDSQHIRDKTRQEKRREDSLPAGRACAGSKPNGNAASQPDDWPNDYADQFWAAYPRKIEKVTAMKKLAALRKARTVTFAELMAGTRRYAKAMTGTEARYIKHPAAWLNAGRWADESASLPRSTSTDTLDEVCPPEIYRGVR